MGNPSYLYYSNLKVKDWNKFYYHLAINLEKVPGFVTNKIHAFSKEQTAELVALKIAGNDKPNLISNYQHAIGDIETGGNYNAEGNIFIDINKWKVQQYWYDDFCQFLWLLQTAGVRGHMEMCYQSYQNFNIYFKDEDVTVEIFEEEQYDEEGNLTNEKECEENYDTYSLSSLARCARRL